MRPKERMDSGQKDLFRARLDHIVEMKHPLAKLAGSVDWKFLETRFGAARGRPKRVLHGQLHYSALEPTRRLGNQR
jgi:hypothetical protein